MSIHDLLDQSAVKSRTARMQQQIKFILEIDKLKSIMRRSPLLDQSRKENDAEHSWHLAMIAMVFSEYASQDVDMNRVIRMLLVHDLVEIDAGDTFLYDQSALSDTKNDREEKAAKRIYGILPEDSGNELHALWTEFEERITPDAIFAAALDRLQPLFLNYFTEGGTWAQYHITAKQVIERKKFIEQASKPLWELAETLINDAKNRGFLRE